MQTLPTLVERLTSALRDPLQHILHRLRSCDERIDFLQL
jgi:hypothetical protein